MKKVNKPTNAGNYVFTEINDKFALSDPSMIIDTIPKNKDQYYTVMEEKYRPDKDNFVFSKFLEDFPNIKAADATVVYKLASRSSVLNEWLQTVNLMYSQFANEPTFYRDYVSAEGFDSVVQLYPKMNMILRADATARFDAVTNYRKKLGELDTALTTALKPFRSNKVMRIITLPSSDLPLSLQLAIENFTTATDVQVVDSKAYAREVLIRYKMSLLSAVSNDPNIDIESIIQGNKVK